MSFACASCGTPLEPPVRVITLEVPGVLQCQAAMCSRCLKKAAKKNRVNLTLAQARAGSEPAQGRVDFFGLHRIEHSEE